MSHMHNGLLPILMVNFEAYVYYSKHCSYMHKIQIVYHVDSISTIGSGTYRAEGLKPHQCFRTWDDVCIQFNLV